MIDPIRSQHRRTWLRLYSKFKALGFQDEAISQLFEQKRLKYEFETASGIGSRLLCTEALISLNKAAVELLNLYGYED